MYRELTQQTLPLDESAFREVISPEYMVFGRKGVGGPQPAEVLRMLEHEHAQAAADRAWLSDRQTHLADAQAGLDTAFAALARQ